MNLQYTCCVTQISYTIHVFFNFHEFRDDLIIFTLIVCSPGARHSHAENGLRLNNIDEAIRCPVVRSWARLFGAPTMRLFGVALTRLFGVSLARQFGVLLSDHGYSVFSGVVVIRRLTVCEVFPPVYTCSRDADMHAFTD